jgi:hypothetical protein
MSFETEELTQMDLISLRDPNYFVWSIATFRDLERFDDLATRHGFSIREVQRMVLAILCGAETVAEVDQAELNAAARDDYRYLLENGDNLSMLELVLFWSRQRDRLLRGAELNPKLKEPTEAFVAQQDQIMDDLVERMKRLPEKKIA